MTGIAAVAPKHLIAAGQAKPPASAPLQANDHGAHDRERAARKLAGGGPGQVIDKTA